MSYVTLASLALLPGHRYIQILASAHTIFCSSLLLQFFLLWFHIWFQWPRLMWPFYIWWLESW